MVGTSDPGQLPPTAAEIKTEFLNTLTSAFVTADTIGETLRMIKDAASSNVTAESLMSIKDTSVAGAAKKNITKGDSDHSHAVATTEADVKIFLANNDLIELVFDCILLLQTTTIRIYEKTDGSTYRLVDSAIYPTDFDGGNVVLALNGKGLDQKVTFQSGTNEAGIINVPFNWVEENRS